MTEQRVYMPHLGLVVVLRPIPASNRAFVGATVRLLLLDAGTAESLRRLGGNRGIAEADCRNRGIAEAAYPRPRRRAQEANMTANREHNPGTRVLITHNPFHAAATGIVGVVTRVEKGAGFMGINLIYVRYQNPVDGEEHEMPFADTNLLPGDRDELIARARRHEAQAAALRRMADEAGRVARDNDQAGHKRP
ncbi:MAG TPA: hypothetical protein VJP77_04285 [Planctomycetota bacterium]|nr:hypothetical protein [Planctomycetota bacterium]